MEIYVRVPTEQIYNPWDIGKPSLLKASECMFYKLQLLHFKSINLSEKKIAAQLPPELRRIVETHSLNLKILKLISWKSRITEFVSQNQPSVHIFLTLCVLSLELPNCAYNNNIHMSMPFRYWVRMLIFLFWKLRAAIPGWTNLSQWSFCCYLPLKQACSRLFAQWLRRCRTGWLYAR